jgi:hypothetical protein
MGGVMTEEAGAITGELELLTRVSQDGGIKVLVRYAGARDLYTVSGSPVHTVSEHSDQVEHRAAHERILEALTTPGGSRAATNCQWTCWTAEPLGFAHRFSSSVPNYPLVTTKVACEALTLVTT